MLLNLVLNVHSFYISPTAYLDEIQDLSYAAIYLICGLAGKDSLRWVCAGDPAQMISPGCSFTFDGLKQTLLSLQKGIEHQLSDAVHHLVVNYRTTRDVLQLGNAILAVARREFPNAIGFAPPEISKKDLGIKVLLCDWKWR
jgi:superfamily I DNA/RNA helicase